MNKTFVAGIPLKEYKGYYLFNEIEYHPLIKISEYPQQIFLSKSPVVKGKVYTLKETHRNVVATLNSLYFYQKVPHIKKTQVRVTIVEVISLAKDIPGRKAVPAMTYKLGEILPDNSVICSISSRWHQKKSGKSLEYVYKDFKKARA